MGLVFGKELSSNKINPPNVQPCQKNPMSDSQLSEKKPEISQDSSVRNSDDSHSVNNQALEREIDLFIEEWFQNNQEVDLGNIEILNQKIDLIPDSMEKLIYKKALIICITFIKKLLQESQISFLNQEINIHISDKSNI